MLLSFLLLLFGLFSTNASVLNNSKVLELKNLLLNNYRPDVIPNRHAPLNLSLGIAFRAFNNIDQKEGIVSLNLWLRYRWNDFHLRWNESEWNNVTSVTLRTDPQIENRII